MEVKHIDIHCHLGFEDYGKDLEEVIKRMKDNRVAGITVGTDFESSKEAVRIAGEFENIFACIGVHPAGGNNSIFDEKEFEELVRNPKVLAIGECGLDYFRPTNDIETEKIHQKKEFIKQIEFAIKHDKPLMLHIREAYDDVYEILKEYKGRARGNVHFFSGSLEWAKKFIELGFTLSFTGVITFAKEYSEVIKNIPLDKIHAETDSPYVAPIPYRGKRNEPSFVIEIVKKIAEIRADDFDKVRMQLLENAKKTFQHSF